MTSLHIHTVPASGPSAGLIGPPVLLIHGLASRGRVDWPDAAWADPLAASGRTVVVVDLPAHGAASRPEGPVTTSQVVDLLAAAAVEVGGTVDVVAYSLGARLAWDLAARGVVRRMVLGGLSAMEPFAMVDLPAARAALSGGPAPTDPFTGMILGMAQLPGLEPQAVLNLVEGLASEPFVADAQPPTIPVLLLGGIDDPMAQGIDGLAALLPDARVVRVPGDHLSALHSAEFHDAAVGFLES